MVKYTKILLHFILSFYVHSDFLTITLEILTVSAHNEYK